MKTSRWLPILSLFVLVLTSVLPADAASVTVARRRGPVHRTTVVVRVGHPLHRPMRAVVYRRPAVVVRVAPVVFLPLVVWRPVVVARPAPGAIAWQDAETFEKEDDWAEVVFNSDQRGDKLYLEVVAGKVQFDFAEVVFENGDCQVVDFNAKAHGAGIYSLLDFKDGRKVDHVRLIAKSRTTTARVALLMAK